MHDTSIIPGYDEDMTRWLTDEEQRAWRGLLQMTAQLEVALNRQLQEHSDLSGADYEVLVPLSEAPDQQLRVFELAAATSWEQSRLSHHLSRMEKRGLITRAGCDSDRRGAHVSLTAAGREAIERAAPAHVEAVRELVFDGLSSSELKALNRLTSRVLGRLGSQG